MDMGAGGPARRPAAGALRALGIARAESPLSQPAEQSRGDQAGTARERVCPAAGRALPLRAHDVPADGAPHERRDDARALAPRRAAAGAVLRDLARAGGRAARRARRVGHDQDGTRRHPRAGHGDPAPAPAAGGWTYRSPGGAALALGLPWTRHRRRRQRPHRDLRGSQLPDHGIESAAVRHRACRSRRGTDAPGGEEDRPWHRELTPRCRAPTRPGTRTWPTAGRSDSSPTRRFASGARPAKSPARNGTRCPRTAASGPATPTTTRAAWAPPPGGT